jgi:CRISPR/Cas system-associated exonuclease Cas4 (RecB family)
MDKFIDKDEFRLQVGYFDQSKYIYSAVIKMWDIEWNKDIYQKNTNREIIFLRIADALGVPVDVVAEYAYAGWFISKVPNIYDVLKSHDIEYNIDAIYYIIHHGAPELWEYRMKYLLKPTDKTQKAAEAKYNRHGYTEKDYQTLLQKQLEYDGYSICSEYCLLGCGYIDILATKPGITLIVEVKLDASRENIRKALGQVLDYENCYRENTELAPDHKIVKIISTPEELPYGMRSLLRKHNIIYELIYSK